MRRFMALTSAAALLSTVFAVVLSARPAEAHGALMIPGSRTYLCWRDGLTPQGNIVPLNPACQAAVAISGDNSLYNWFGVLNSNSDGRRRGYIPDGKICSGNNPAFSGYDLARTDWPVTHLTAGATIEFRYNKWAAHPGWFNLYITKDSWDPTRPLTWDDLEEEPFFSIQDPPSVGPAGQADSYYFWTARLPANKSGRHIIFSHWVRSDSPEDFFGCSDVVFDGGNGEVTGIGRNNGTSTTAPTSTAPTTTAPTTTAPTTTRPTTTTSPGQQQCTATYRVVNSWSGGFQAEVTVTNSSSSTLNGWTVRWTLPSGQTITQLWNGVLTTSGSSVTVRNESWNRSIPPNSSTAFGFLGSGSSGSTPSLSCTSP